MKITNVQDLIDRVKPTISNCTEPKYFSWTRYHTLEEINAWLDILAERHSELSIIVAGRSYEEAGIHVREWISPSTALYILNQLLTSKDPKVRKLAKKYDWYIIPVYNPDGYIYTFNDDRLWRKSRVPLENGCFGVDLNRNWDSKWMATGATNKPCDDNYAGTKPFSEVETKTTSEYLMSILDKLFAFISFHVHGQYLLLSYGYTTEHLENYDELFSIGKKTIESLHKVYGTTYDIGNPPEIFTFASGISMDWVKEKLILPITFTFELRDKGKYGCVLPPEQIIPTGKEMLNSILTMFEEASKMGYPNMTLFK